MVNKEEEEGRQCQIMIRGAFEKYNLPASESAIQLLCMIAAHESGGFRYNKQVNGSALSIFQVEPPSYHEVVAYGCSKGYLNNQDNLSEQRLLFDPTYAAAIARIFFLRFVEPIPDKGDIEGLAKYAKHYWNTNRGKATCLMYENAWNIYYGPK
ncbi:hypothetical protein M3P05_05500 [Sansalvadorimonas sp. 2012CJ34-2]|uniref:Transglycosylase SLT domain-containing protein n=1 Tax=Parendozoicomonas callyspongiae TaxID=2942213 RepID=A0ABT0PDU6_9GAMM|nr:hypothetical protein [Sansalvadorimonas sp. 2012CJ34-2]MCL6269401.1 hypothetical protein [Sansalvadorimonas sp. 2012CJ34-2]